MKKYFLIGLLWIGPVAFAQEQNFWQVLAQVGFENKKDKNGYDVEVPVFSKYLKTFQGKKVRLKGYII